MNENRSLKYDNFLFLQVSKERIRVLEYMRDYDKLRSGRVQKISFRRALDLCRFELKESEVCILEDKYVYMII